MFDKYNVLRRSPLDGYEKNGFRKKKKAVALSLQPSAYLIY